MSMLRTVNIYSYKCVQQTTSVIGDTRYQPKTPRYKCEALSLQLIPVQACVFNSTVERLK